MREGRKTLTRYTIESEHRHPGSTGDFSGLLNAVATAVKIISNQVSRGALAGPLGSAGVQNVHGDLPKKLDLISNDVMIGETEWTGYLAAMASEEMAGIRPVVPAGRRGKYLLVFDPLAHVRILLARRILSARKSMLLKVPLSVHEEMVHAHELRGEAAHDHEHV